MTKPFIAITFFPLIITPTIVLTFVGSLFFNLLLLFFLTYGKAFLALHLKGHYVSSTVPVLNFSFSNIILFFHLKLLNMFCNAACHTLMSMTLSYV